VNGRNAAAQDDIPAGGGVYRNRPASRMEPRRSLLRIYFISATLTAFHIR
jgi:hypothetical protein